MKSSAEIQFDYENAMAQANRLDSVASNVENSVVRSMESAAECLHTAWKGASATRLLGKETELCAQVSQTAREMRNVAGDVRTVARRMYHAEQEAVRLMETRKT